MQAASPLPLSGIALHSVLPPSVNVTVPEVTSLPPLVTVAVRVTEPFAPLVNDVSFDELELSEVVVLKLVVSMVVITRDQLLTDTGSPGPGGL
jgi:hypothetical protein